MSWLGLESSQPRRASTTDGSCLAPARLLDLILRFSAAMRAERGLQATAARGCSGCARWVFVWGLTFEVTGARRQDALARLAKMYSVPPTGPRWPAVARPVDRGARRHLRTGTGEAEFLIRE